MNKTMKMALMNNYYDGREHGMEDREQRYDRGMNNYSRGGTYSTYDNMRRSAYENYNRSGQRGSYGPDPYADDYEGMPRKTEENRRMQRRYGRDGGEPEERGPQRRVGFQNGKDADDIQAEREMRKQYRRKMEEQHKVIPMRPYEDEDEEEENLTMQEAREWVNSMESSNPQDPSGGRWDEEEVKEYAKKVGMPTEGQEFIDFYAAMNAAYSDYSMVAKEFQVHRPEFYAALAKAWVCDMDAVDNKAAMYYRYVVKHD